MKVTVNQVVYHLTSEGNGTPLVLLHGFSGSVQTWTPLIRDFAASHRVICIDLLGHGGTDHPPDACRYTMDKQTSDLLAILDHLQIHQTALLGYSMGGRTALSFACSYPERIRRLVLESASPGLKTVEQRRRRRQRDEHLAAQIIDNGIVSFADYWARIPLFASQATLPETVKQVIRNERLSNSAIGLAGSLRGMGTGAQPSLWPKLTGLHLPTLLITGGNDSKFCGIAREMSGQLPLNRTAVVDGCGHNVHLENREQFSQLVRVFLDEEARR
ncbi:MAG: 2-succinyl-6-hydroxy-2,4-cyclohexadiene-1-carboxylate synthase [Sporolactobacillus sp.]